MSLSTKCPCRFLILFNLEVKRPLPHQRWGLHCLHLCSFLQIEMPVLQIYPPVAQGQSHKADIHLGGSIAPSLVVILSQPVSNFAYLLSPPSRYWKRWSSNSIPPLPSSFMCEGPSLRESRKKKSIRLSSSFIPFWLPAAMELSQQGPQTCHISPAFTKVAGPKALMSPQSQPLPRPRPGLLPLTRVPGPLSHSTLFLLLS